jgi:hypothetical protein
MPRHYSTILVQLPEPGEPPEVVIHFECDQCPPAVWKTHPQHLGTLVRVLTAILREQGGDDGVTEPFTRAAGPATPERIAAMKAAAHPALLDFKARRKRARGRNG